MLETGCTGTVYLLHGEEEFMKEAALNRIIRSMDGAARDLNIQYLESADAAALRAACETLPFFSDRRLVVCRQLPKDDDAKKILAYLDKIPDSTLLLFYVRGKANEKLGIVKELKKKDAAVVFDTVGEHEAAQWALNAAPGYGTRMSPEAARFLISLVGTDMAGVHNELSKAAGYAGEGGEITVDIIKTAVTRNIEYRVFDMLEYFMAGKADGGMHALNSLIRDGEPPIRIAGFLEGRFKQMLTARMLMDKGLPYQKTIELMGGNAYAAKKSYEAAKRFSFCRLCQAVKSFADICYLQVSGQARDREALEKAIIEHVILPA